MPVQIEEMSKLEWIFRLCETCDKYKESANMALIHHPISHPCLDISHIRIPIIATEWKKKKENYNSV
jgi:hypothetical protein